MAEQKSLGRTIVTSFIVAGAIILAGAFAAPHFVTASKAGCAPSYGVDPCAQEFAADAAK
ncbi:hypothetical protein K1W69_13690 [Hoeflea sp. WL0058]|uniref:Uncharacterized protein n=1 Tax=Flavimaribacter sediminis TaxID=2865987 RepID=A0AAE3D273_9HYPH|nr:hypothetical protein [Flavimaribacter sediminis]MBW8638243.1 hypothetical protein [Flavimaribacter sediminis]